MTPLVRPCLLAALLGIWLAGCSPDNPATAGAPSLEVAAMHAPDAQNPADVATIQTDDPCKLLTDAEVQQAFPGTSPGRREHGLDKYGIATCQWDTPADRFIVQMFKVESGTVEDELRSRVSGSIDPLMPRAAGVRYVTVAGVGDQAMSVVEKADPQRGILADTAVLVTQRDGRRAVLFTGNFLAGGDRESALQSLETLGRSAAKRL